MPITLTDADRAEIHKLQMLYAASMAPCTEMQYGYIAGIAAGLERALTECDREREIYKLGPPGSLQNDVQQMGRSACWGCAAAIRALIK
jgi:hypothetical protein